MTIFNPDNKDVLSYGECLDPAMKITDENDAKQYFDAYVKYTERQLQKEPRSDNMTADQICKINIGYYAGYYDQKTRKRVEYLFETNHPIFGSVTK